MNGFGCAWRQVVQRACDQLLAGARLAVDHRGGVGRCHLVHRLDHLEHPRLRGDDALDVPLLVQLAAQPLHLGSQVRVLHRLAQDELQLLQVERLREVLARPGLHRLDGGFHVAVGGEHDDRERQALAAHPAQHFHAVGLGHAVVEQHRVGRRVGDCGKGFLAVLGFDDVETLTSERLGQDPPHVLLVIDDQDALCHEGPFETYSSRAGIDTVNFVPAGPLSTSICPSCSSRIRWTMVSPRPVPSDRFVKNGSKTLRQVFLVDARSVVRDGHLDVAVRRTRPTP